MYLMGGDGVRADAQNTAARFEALAAPLERQVYFTCLGMMGHPQDAEDCAQEAMLKAYRGFAGFRGDAQFSTWLYAIATRTCLDALRKRREVYSLDLLREDGVEPVFEGPDAYSQLETKERKAALKAAIAKLPPDFRAALVLTDLQGLPYQEAALALDIPLGTVKSRVNRARNALRIQLSDLGELFGTVERLNDERREPHGL